jgi:putative oxidoreductase
MKLARLIVRIVIGGLFVGHGTQKLFGWFNGPGPENTGQFFESLGLRPGRRHAAAAGASEALGGALLAVGLMTPAAVAALSGVMITAIRKVHAKNGVWATEGGFEYNLVLLAALLAIAEEGPGPVSADARLGIGMSGPGWALAALGAGALGSYAMTELTPAEPAAPQPQAEPEPEAVPEPVAEAA